MAQVQIEQRLNRIDREMEKVSQSSSKTNRLMLFILAAFLLVLALSSLFLYRLSTTIGNRLDNLERVTQVLATTPQEVTQEPMPGDEALVSVNARLTSLETLQEAIVSTSKGALEQMNFVFAIVAAFFGLFALFFAYRQTMADTSREAHDVEMRSLVASFQNNINTISSLIVTLEKGYEYRQQVAEQLSDIREQTESLERYQEASNLKFGALTAELNSDAVRLFNVEIDRAGLSREENRRKLERFAAKINNAEAIRDIEDLLNPFCYFLRGLHHVATYQYESAISDLQIAHRKGKVDLVDSRLKNYAEQDKENLGALLQDMIVSCSHFQGVSLKNLGRYSEARDKFQEALDRNPLHRQSKTYLLQVMYFDPSFPFASIESEYEKAVEEFQNALTSAPSLDERKKLRKTFSVLRVNQGNMYLRKLIDLGVRPDHKQLENREKALRYYEEAYSYVEPYEDLSNYVAGFSVAQAMEDVGSSVWDEKSPLYFYREAMRSLRKRVAEDRDPLYSVLLYYMLAICADKLDEDGRSADVFLSQARHSLKEVPSDVTCFSPICKVRLHRSQILEEMDRFEEAFLRGGG